MTALVLALLLQSQAPSTVTFSQPAAPASRLLPALGKAMGVRLVPGSEMDSEVLFVSVKDAAPKDVLTNIAAVSSGAWRKEGNSYVLTADSQRRDREDEEWLEAKVEAIHQQLRTLADPQALEAFRQRAMAENPSLALSDLEMPPDQKFIAQVASSMDLKALVLQVAKSQRVVYSTSPNSSELPLSVDPQEVAAFMAAYNAFMVKQMEVGIASIPDAAQREDARNHMSKAGFQLTVPPAKVLLIVSGPGQAPLTAELVFKDANGDVLYRGGASLEFDQDSESTRPAQVKAKFPIGRRVVWSPESAWLLASNDPEDAVSPNAMITLFDDAAPPPKEKQSRALEIHIGLAKHRAALVHQYLHTPPTLAYSQGSVELLHNGNVFVGWGSRPYFSEYSERGARIFGGSFPAGVQSYRAYRFSNWVGKPLQPPAIAVRSSSTVGRDYVYVSWNGATRVARWQVLGSASRSGAFRKLGSAVKWSSFETRIQTAKAKYFKVEALDSRGHVLPHGVSAVVAGP